MENSALKILLLDDDIPTLELYQRELSRTYLVFACATESEAFTLIYGHQMEAIILEPALRSGQGWAFLAMLRGLPQTRTTPVVLCSILDERRRGRELGATICLVKPVLPAELRNTLDQVVYTKHKVS
jgi:DNA-binding response OmpR family regulator